MSFVSLLSNRTREGVLFRVRRPTLAALGGAARSAQLTLAFDAPDANEAPAKIGPTKIEPATYPVVSPSTTRLADAPKGDSEHSLDVHHLTRAVRDAAGIHIELVLTENRRTMISTRRAPHGLVVRVHRMFLRAGPTVVAALGRYLSRRDARASRLVGEFIESQRAMVRAAPPRKLRALGHHHDLARIFEEVNQAELGGAAAGVSITWGKRGTRARGRKRSIRLGTYTRDELLVRVHPALDSSWVPHFFVRYIVFHELLHHVEPEVERNGRTEYHTERFRQRERVYGDYAKAIAWERENLGRLLRA